jgi:hypothetical protein
VGCFAQIVLFQADWQESEWNRLAAATADVVLLVANAADKPQISMLETVRLVCEPFCVIQIPQLTPVLSLPACTTGAHGADDQCTEVPYHASRKPHALLHTFRHALVD